MQPIRTAYNTAVDKNEVRTSQYGAMNVFQKQSAGMSSILTSEIEAAIKASVGRTIEIPVLDAETVTLGNTRTCTISPSENTSQLITLTFIPVSFGFTMVPAQHGNNDISYEQDYARKMKKYLVKLADYIDELCVARLGTDKNQKWASEITNTYAQVSNALQVPKDEHYDFYNQLSGIMKVMDFYGNYDIVANTMHEPLVRRHRSQGASNDENDQFQFSLGYNYNFTNNVTNRSGVHSTIYVVGEGSVAMSNRNHPDHILKHRTGDKEWGTTRLPLVDLEVESFYVRDCADMSALHAGTSHLTRTLVEGFAFSTDLVLMTVYNSDPVNRENPIVKAEMWATNTAPV